MTERTRMHVLVDASEALWGPRCQTELSKALGVNVSTVQRWLEGRGAPKPRASAALYPLVEERIRQLQALSNELRRDTPLT